MTEKILSSIVDQTQSISIDPSALLTTSTINGLHFPDLTTSGISETSNTGRPFSLNLDGVGMCESMTESYCSVTGFDETALLNNNANTNGLQTDTSMSNSIKLNSKKDPMTESYMKAQKKRRSRKAQYDATNDGFSLDKIDIVPINEEQTEADDAWLFQIPESGNKTTSNVENIYSWVHKEFKENEINANKHRLLCKLDDMSHARTIRSVSCHSFPSGQRSESVKRSATEQQVNPGRNEFDLSTFIVRHNLTASDFRENALFLTDIFNKDVHLSTISLDSIDKESNDRFNCFLYDSLNDESSPERDEKFFPEEKFFIETIGRERRMIEELTRRCSSLDSLDNDEPFIRPKRKTTTNTRLTSPLRSSTPSFNGNGSTRPTSPINSSPLRHTVTITNNSSIRSRDVSREREPLDYTDVEVMAKVQLENLRQAERQGQLTKRFGGSSNTLLSADSRDASPVSVFGATRNTSPVSHTGLLTPRRSHSPNPSAVGSTIPRRKNSFVVTDSQYAHVLPSVSPRSSSPAVRSGQWSGRETPSTLEPCMEASFIAPDNSLPSHRNSDAQGGSNLSLASNSSTSSVPLTNRPGTKPPVVPRNGTKPNNHRRSNTQTIVANVDGGFDIPDITEPKVDVNASTNRNNVQTTTNRARPSGAAPRQIQAYRGSQTSHIQNSVTQTKSQSNVERTVKKPSVDLGTTYTASKFSSSNENNFLNDLSNKPLKTNGRPPTVNQRRTPLVAQGSHEPQMTPSASLDMTVNVSSSIPRSSSNLSQLKKSGIPTIGKTSRTNLPTPTRTSNNAASNVIPTSQSSDNMMNTRNIRAQPTNNVARPQIPDATSPSASWNEGCY